MYRAHQTAGRFFTGLSGRLRIPEAIGAAAGNRSQQRVPTLLAYVFDAYRAADHIP
ncbi:hypothetical protein B4098_0516 [Heyndrickxia coagulans]|uniref:Uncharacterized protein n=1 Tax=Heyndrickxia coagulans TaxID=1398 RepID=A0A150K5N6_HEYCO|nr:hypothetical protein B4098_0516 [Heyndrickxia coagulans]